MFPARASFWHKIGPEALYWAKGYSSRIASAMAKNTVPARDRSDGTEEIDRVAAQWIEVDEGPLHRPGALRLDSNGCGFSLI